MRNQSATSKKIRFTLLYDLDIIQLSVSLLLIFIVLPGCSSRERFSKCGELIVKEIRNCHNKINIFGSNDYSVDWIVSSKADNKQDNIKENHEYNSHEKVCVSYHEKIIAIIPQVSYESSYIPQVNYIRKLNALIVVTFDTNHRQQSGKGDLRISAVQGKNVIEFDSIEIDFIRHNNGEVQEISTPQVSVDDYGNVVVGIVYKKYNDDFVFYSEVDYLLLAQYSYVNSEWIKDGF